MIAARVPGPAGRSGGDTPRPVSGRAADPSTPLSGPTATRSWPEARHVGHGLEGEEGDLRRGRRFAVARRLAGLFSSYAVQRPGLVADWAAGRFDAVPGDSEFIPLPEPAKPTVAKYP